MQTSNAIEFSYKRLNRLLVNNTVTEAWTDHGSLPLLFPHTITVDKTSTKIYMTYANDDSMYQPMGMQGPVVKLKASVANLDAWRDVYANDVLTVVAFNYPTWNVTLAIGSEWWVDIRSMDTGPGKMHDGEIHYILDLDLYKRTSWSE